MNLLLVEDNPGDVRLTEEAFNMNEIELNLHVAYDGEQALNFIFQRNGYENVPRPDAILMDINIPKYSGIEVLEKIKKDDNLKYIPIVMLTTSNTKQDLSRCYDLGVNAYMVKPIDFERFLNMTKAFYNFWFNSVVTVKKEIY